MKIIITGFKNSGKTRTGQALAEKLGIEFKDLDWEVERNFEELTKEKLNKQEIFKKFGEEHFRNLEKESLEKLQSKREDFILSLGGGTIVLKENRPLIKALGTVVYRKVELEELWSRMQKKGLPAFINKNHPYKSFVEIYKQREAVYEELADIVVEEKESEDAAEAIVKKLSSLLSSRAKSERV